MSEGKPTWNVFVAGVIAGLWLGVGLTWAFPHQTVPAALKCGMRTLDGCAIWFSAERIERYKRGEAGAEAKFILPEGER